jgi:hypothetical protein
MKMRVTNARRINAQLPKREELSSSIQFPAYHKHITSNNKQVNQITAFKVSDEELSILRTFNPRGLIPSVS